MRVDQKQDWLETVKTKRLTYGLSQNKLAVTAGITRQYLSDIETGKQLPSEQVQDALTKALEWLNPDNPLEMLFDYVRIRFPTNKVSEVIEGILRINMDYMLHEDYGYYSYTETYRFGDVMILTSHDKEKGTLLELKGKGCRQLENFLLAQHRTWFDFFQDCMNARSVMKRLDLAINDKVGILDIPELIEKCRNEECISVFRSFKNYRSGELVHRDEKPDMGNTLYIGSLKSEVYFCVYEKDYEQYVKNDIAVEDAEIKNRFELRLKNERATHALKKLLESKDSEKVVFEIINRYVRFVDQEPDKKRNNWKLNERWSWFIGNDRGALRLTTQPEPYNFNRTLNWLHHQVAAMLKVTDILDGVYGTTVLPEMIQNAKLTEKHEKIIEQLSTDIEDVIL